MFIIFMLKGMYFTPKAARLKGFHDGRSWGWILGTAEWLSCTGAPNTASVWMTTVLNYALWEVS